MASINLIDSFQDFKEAEGIDRPTLMKVVEDGEFVEISVQESGGKIRHLVMYIEESGREIQLISITGIIDLDQISKLSGTLNIEGLELIEGK